MRQAVVAAAANRQPALAVYTPNEGGYTPLAIKVLTIRGGLITAVTGFVEPRLFTRFGLPPTLELQSNPLR